MGAIESGRRRTQLAERPAMKRRHRPGARQGARGRQGAHPGLRGRRHRHAPRRHARVLHRAQGVVRPGRRAHLPAALADDPEGRGRAVGQGPPREALLPARAEGQGGAHEGSHGARRSAGRGTARVPWRGSRPRGRSRTRCGGSGSSTSPASTKSAAAAWPGRSWRPPSCCIPTGTFRGLADSKLVPAAERERLYELIAPRRCAWAVAEVGTRPRSIASTSTRRRCERCGARCWRWRRCRTSCWSTRSAFPVCRWRSAASCTATAAARPLPRRRSSPR